MKTRTKWILGIIGAIVALGIIGALAGSGDDEPEKVTGDNTPNAAATAKPTDAPVPPTAALPTNQAQVGNLLLTVNGAATHIDDLFPAEAGTHYVAVDITALNTGDKTYSLNRFNFRLKDSDKFTAEPAISNGPEPTIGSHDMVPGQEVRGYIVFKIGDTRTPIELQYQSFTGSATTIPIP